MFKIQLKETRAILIHHFAICKLTLVWKFHRIN